MEAKLQVLIPILGRKGMEDTLRNIRPEIEGVEYLYSWQQPDEDIATPEELQTRRDCRVRIVKSRGVARNRNSLLEMVTAPLILWSDDHDSNSEAQIKRIMEIFEEHPALDIAAFKTERPALRKDYPDHTFDYTHRPKGYWAGTPEMAMRMSRIKGRFRFNEHFGVGAQFPAGEDEIFAFDCVKGGLNWRYFPETLAYIPDTSTTQKIHNSEGQIRTKGAMLMHFYPLTWPLRMVAHTLRYVREPDSRGMRWYVRNWLHGVIEATREGVFKQKATRNQSKMYQVIF